MVRRYPSCRSSALGRQSRSVHATAQSRGSEDFSQDTPLAAFEVPNGSAVGRAAAGTSWEDGVRESWSTDWSAFLQRYESNDSLDQLLKQNVHVSYLCDLQMKRNAHLLPAFLEHVYRAMQQARTKQGGSQQSFAATRLIVLLQSVFDVVPVHAAKGTLKVLHGLLNERLESARDAGDRVAPVVEAFTYVGFLTNVMAAVRMCPSSQIQPMAPLRWLGIAGRGELAECEEALQLS